MEHKFLSSRKTDQLDSRTIKTVSSHIAEGARRRKSKCGWVEPLIDGLMTGHRISDLIGIPISRLGERIIAAADYRRKRRAVRENHCARGLPATDHSIEHMALIQERFSCAEGKFVHNSSLE